MKKKLVNWGKHNFFCIAPFGLIVFAVHSCANELCTELIFGLQSYTFEMAVLSLIKQYGVLELKCSIQSQGSRDAKRECWAQVRAPANFDFLVKKTILPRIQYYQNYERAPAII